MISDAILFALALAVGIIWIYSLVNWDGKSCAGGECDNCPFPCDKQENQRRNRK